MKTLVVNESSLDQRIKRTQSLQTFERKTEVNLRLLQDYMLTVIWDGQLIFENCCSTENLNSSIRPTAKFHKTY